MHFESDISSGRPEYAETGQPTGMSSREEKDLAGGAGDLSSAAKREVLF